MSQVFEVKQADMLYQAYLGEPVFGMFRDLDSLLTWLFRQLRLRPRISDTRFESNESIGEAHLSVTLPGITARVYMDRVEVQSSLPVDMYQHQDEVLVDVLEALASYLPNVSWKAFTSTLSLHGVVQGTTAGEYLARFSAPKFPQSLGPLLGAGTIFYYGAEEGKLASSVTLDFSALVQEGIFLKLRVIQDAAGMAPTDLPPTFRHQSGTLFAELELALGS